MTSSNRKGWKLTAWKPAVQSHSHCIGQGPYTSESDAVVTPAESLLEAFSWYEWVIHRTLHMKT